MTAWEEREEDLEAQLNKGALWAVTYGDMMSYLMLLFLILFVAGASKSVAIQMSLMAAEEMFGGKAHKFYKEFGGGGGAGAQQIARMEIRENKMRMIFAAPVLFDSGSAALKPESEEHLARLASALKDLPNAVQVEGHTDDRPLAPGVAFKSNWELSAARAFAVLRFFEARGLPPHRLSAIGYGEFRPLKPNDTAEGRAANRRIEVNITRADE